MNVRSRLDVKSKIRKVGVLFRNLTCQLALTKEGVLGEGLAVVIPPGCQVRVSVRLKVPRTELSEKIEKGRLGYEHTARCMQR